MQTNLCAGSALFDWKVAYDEDFARYGPGVQLQLRVLEQACQDGLSWIDSCSEVTDDHQLRLSPARRRIATLAIGREGRLARWALSFGVLLAKLRRQLAGFSVRTARYELSEASRVIARRVPVIVARGRLRERGDEAQEKPVRLGGRRAWFPIQAGYNPHPWWKFEHLRRAHPVLMPLWKRHYPVGADIAPPADVEALARWMDRWGLLPGQLTASTVRRQLEALVSAPVESITADVAPAVGSRDGLRLPAEWEPTEAVVLTWPVLYPGLWDFYSELVAAVAPVARVDVLIPDAIYAPAVRAYLGEAWHEDARLRCLVTASDDIWVRDYGPLTCLDGGGRRVMVDAIFDPPPAMPFANDDAFPARYAAHEGIPCCDLALHLEGGNLWSDGRGTIITTEGLFARNPHLPSEEVRRRLLDALGAETLIVVPRLRMEDTGHVDVFVKLATPETVLVTEPRSLVNRRRLTLTAELLASSRTAAGERYRVVRLPSVPHYRNWGVVRVWPNYANSLTVNGRVLVPTYGDPARDAAALDVYQQAMPGHEIIAIDAHVVANAGGTVHCLTMQIPAAQS
jgi:agmatine deiminase